MTTFSYESLPKKRTASGAIIRNGEGKFLIVKPTYRPDWLIPGGTIEQDESPLTCCIREVKEETQLEMPAARLLMLAYCPRDAYSNEMLQFIFDGGVLADGQAAKIELPTDELSDYRFISPAEMADYFRPGFAHWVGLAFKALQAGAGGVVYVEEDPEVI